MIALVNDIDPDIVLCRCADHGPVRHFPGEVRFIMEGAIPPFATDPCAVVLDRDLLSFGQLPDLSFSRRQALADCFASFWADMGDRADRMPSVDWRSSVGCAADRKVALLVLEYEHPENHFLAHRRPADNASWIRSIAAELDPSIFLAVTNHPLNDLYVDTSAVNAAIAELGGRGALVPRLHPDIGATEMVMRDCDGAIVDLSKSYSMAAYYGKPILRQSHLRTASWLNAADTVEGFARAITDGAMAPLPDRARLWFAFHVANNIVDPNAADLTAQDIIDRVVKPVDPDRWRGNVARLADFQMETASC